MTAPAPHCRRREPDTPHRFGRLGWRPVAGPVQFLGRLTQGILAAAMLAALLGALPWALWHYIGWPLPTQVPTGAQLQALLLAPMTTQFLLDVLACLCWITWVAFILDVARCAADAARGAHWPNVAAAGPVHTVAAVLVGAIMLSILGHRSAPPQTAPSTMTGTTTAVIATAAAWHPDQPDVATAVLATRTHTTLATAAQPESVVVAAPRGGVHDSLWRIAERTLDDGARWPEIFELNRGKPQPDGGTFTTPSVIFPGEELALPPQACTPPVTAVAPPTRQPVPPVVAPPTSPAAPPPSSTPASSTPASSATLTPSTRQTPPPAGTTTAAPTTPGAEPGVRGGPELFVGLGLATAVSTALLIARRRYRRTYRPGSGRRDDFPVAPVVYQLRLAHLRHQDN